VKCNLKNTIRNPRSLVKTSTKVRSLKLVTLLEFFLLNNWVGQINSNKELNKISCIKEYSIKTTKTSSKTLYMFTSNWPESNHPNI
jgi:hypothetical protein